MAAIPTKIDAGYFILDIFVKKFNCRPDDVLRINNFLITFSQSPWRSVDFKNGMEFCADNGWVEIIGSRGNSFKLTKVGFAAEGRREMDLNEHCNEFITLEKVDGSCIENISSLVTGEMVLVPNSTIPIEIGDAILRKLPSGLVDRLIVTDPGFFAKISDTNAHYQVKYRKGGQKTEGTPGYIINNYGENSRANINSIDNSSNSVKYVSQNLSALASELGQLRGNLLPKANTADHYAAIGSVANAEIAAKAQDPSKVQQALSTLNSGAKWVLETAKEIGVSVAAEAISKSVGL